MKRLAAAVAAIIAVITLLTFAPRACASQPSPVLMAGQEWLIKDNDLAVIGDVGQYNWTGCGMTTKPSDPAHNYTPCSSGQDPIYTDYYTLNADIQAGRLTSGSTIIFDQETWAYTPKSEQRHPELFDRKAAQLAASHGVNMIATPYAHTDAKEISQLASVAPYVPVVSIQSQEYDRFPARFAAFVKAAVKAIRLRSKTVTILAGLAPDAGGIPVHAYQMFAEYQSVKSLVSGFWLNADVWLAPRGEGCATSGCRGVVRYFLMHDLGVV